ncbi:MAG: Rpn family recombination-promoting nuclease/putative transposase [Bacteroidales bacterium]|nr:Rpn family recombination-promoting nuclease/putative transposase [Bacteroidales bacterium]
MTETRKENGRIIQRYVDILTNGGFKALFGDAQNKDVVMSIINVLLPDHRQVVDIEYLPTEHQGQLVDFSKEYQYDFMCRDISGAVFIVELQRYRDDHWFKRCVSYASRAYDRQNRKGEDYDVPPVYLIGLMGVEVDHPDKEYWRDKYVSEYTFREKNCHDLLGETIVIIFAEMANFRKDSEDCVTEVDKMLYVLKNIGKMLDQPHWLQHEVYTRIFNACEIAGFTEDKRIKYEKEMYDERRLKSEMQTAKRLGFEQGVKEGREEGREELIRTIHSKGFSVMEIAQMLDMDPARIEIILADS